MIEACRSCGEKDLRTILSYGTLPLADLLLSEADLARPEPAYPLELVFCPRCALVQITEDVPPEILYSGDYPYFSSVSPSLVKHFQDSARELIERCRLGPGSLVIEAASNDGCMLVPFVERGIPVLGIDPAREPAAAANRAGLTTLCRYFGPEVARELHGEGRLADLLLGNNVLNLIEDLEGFMEASLLLMKPEGLMVLEVPYVVDLIGKTAFDNVFHQNISYFSATSLDRLFRRHGLFLSDVTRIPTFGGSLRIFVERRDAPGEAVRALLEEERSQGVDRFPHYQDFAGRVEAIRGRLRGMLLDLKERGKRIAVYGAGGGMATTLLSYVGVDRSIAEYAVDRNEHKQGRYIPGSRLKVLPPSTLVEDRPDCVILAAWNFADEVLEQEKAYRRAGGSFLIPIPEPHYSS